jgi:predicted Zn finger-like uncharacterized protein
MLRVNQMPAMNSDDALLLIRCPSCGQRFKVADDLRGRTVECGGCEHRFRINNEAIVRGKKFYPGERPDSKTNRFQRVPLSLPLETSGIVPTYYADAPDLTAFEPTSPQRIMAGMLGVIGMVSMALLLIFGAHRGGALDGMTTDNRLLMAGFTGVLGILLLVYANPRARSKAIGTGLLLGASLLGLPFFFTVGSVPLSDPSVVSLAPHKKTTSQKTESESVTALRALIGTDPLVLEIERLKREGSAHRAVGLWLKGLREQNRFLVRDYILRVTGADPQSHYYSRGHGDFLMVVTGINQSLDEMAVIAAAFGTVASQYPEISVVEVRVNNESMTEGSIEQLTDRGAPAFYDLNLKELDSIDLGRVLRAVQRLADVEPKIYRSDITQKLLALMGARGVTFKPDLCRALAVWSEQPGPASEAALKEAKDLLDRKAEVPQEIISLIIKEKNPAVVPIIDDLWLRNSTRWESFYGEIGAPAEATLIRRFPNTEGMLRHSIVRLLGRVGGAASLPLLDSAMSGADAELKVLLKKSAASIRSRLSP